MASYERKLGRRDGIRYAITWLHAQAKTMNDPHAQIVLNMAASDLGTVLRDSQDPAFTPSHQNASTQYPLKS